MVVALHTFWLSLNLITLHDKLSLHKGLNMTSNIQTEKSSAHISVEGQKC